MILIRVGDHFINPDLIESLSDAPIVDTADLGARTAVVPVADGLVVTLTTGRSYRDPDDSVEGFLARIDELTLRSDGGATPLVTARSNRPSWPPDWPPSAVT